MVGTAISTGAGLLGALVGGIGAGRARRKAQGALNQEVQDNTALFNREYYADSMDRSDNQSLLRNLRGLLNEQAQRSRQTAAITGATPEQQVAQQAAANNTIANAAGNISALNSRYKDNVMNRYLNQRRNLYNQQQGVYNQDAQSWTNMMQNGLNLATAGAGAVVQKLLNPNA